VFLSFKRDLTLDTTSISVLAGSLLAIVSLLFGATYQKVKAKLKQLQELLATIIEADEDDKVTEEEFEKIIAKAKALLNQ
jgi:hypothetical protein